MNDDMPLPDRMIRDAQRQERRDRLAPKGINVTEADIGRSVVYRAAPNFEPEQGVVTSFNDKNVFVRYGSSIRGVATNPDDLDWMVRNERALTDTSGEALRPLGASGVIDARSLTSAPLPPEVTQASDALKPSDGDDG